MRKAKDIVLAGFPPFRNICPSFVRHLSVNGLPFAGNAGSGAAVYRVIAASITKRFVRDTVKRIESPAAALQAWL
jgi:hypothetical protein